MKTHPAPRQLMDGILLGESPRWHHGKLWFADWVGQKLFTLTESGEQAVEAEIASLPFSIDWLPDGTLLVVNAAEKALQRREADGRFVMHADLAPLSDYGSNEIVVDGRGNIYINNINFDFPGGEFQPGFIAVATPDGAVREVAGELAFPNGMAITPDGKTLVCAESFNGNLTAFDIEADGSLINRRLWAGIEGQGADGICMDAEGCVWASSGPRCIRIREGGEVLETVPLDRMAFACMLGGDDGRTLFIVANEWTGKIDVGNPTGRVYATRVDVPHAGFPKAI
jgi:sugar lactone lactonase YvrE